MLEGRRRVFCVNWWWHYRLRSVLIGFGKGMMTLKVSSTCNLHIDAVKNRCILYRCNNNVMVNNEGVKNTPWQERPKQVGLCIFNFRAQQGFREVSFRRVLYLLCFFVTNFLSTNYFTRPKQYQIWPLSQANFITCQMVLADGFGMDLAKHLPYFVLTWASGWGLGFSEFDNQPHLFAGWVIIWMWSLPVAKKLLLRLRLEVLQVCAKFRMRD